MADPEMNGAHGFAREIRVSRASLRGVTPTEMRMIRDLSGLPLSQIMDDANADTAPEKIQMTAWLAMRRAGTPVSWEEAAEFLVEEIDDEPDPTNGSSTTRSPGSAATGG